MTLCIELDAMPPMRILKALEEVCTSQAWPRVGMLFWFDVWLIFDVIVRYLSLR